MPSWGNREWERLYWVWGAMRARCENPQNKYFQNYGGRGVTVCDDWKTFENFERDMAPRPDGGLLERINNDAGYSASNCRWATRKEQNSNRRYCIYVVFEGERLTLKEACRKIGIPYETVRKWIRFKGIPAEQAFDRALGRVRA